MSRYLWLLDAGHGGVIDGIPQTAGKRSPEWEKGILYEGVMNRIILGKVAKMMDNECLPYVVVTPEETDISLEERARRINKIAESSDCIALSFHCNAFTSESANGWSAFTTVGQTKSDKVAEVLYKHAKESKFKIRTDLSDGDMDKERMFFILRKTTFAPRPCPCVLIENFFMTNKKDYLFLMSEKGQNKIARAIFNAIKEIENEGV